MGVRFEASRHIRNVLSGPEVRMLSSDGSELDGIVGVAGASDVLESGAEIGADRIIMQPGTQFALHTHPGAHILFVLRARGFIHVDGVDYEMGAGDTVYVPANFAHGVKTDPRVDQPFEILAFGVPHMPVESAERMTLVDPAGEPAERWELASDPAEVHDLLVASDAHHAVLSGTEAPVRNPESTRTKVESGAVRLLRAGSDAVGMFTLTETAPFDPAPVPFPPAERPVYLSRLVVSPRRLRAGDGLTGVRCVRKAIELAAEQGADSLRCEVNPDLRATWDLLSGLRFVPCGPPVRDHTGRARAYLHRDLSGRSGQRSGHSVS